LLKRRFKNLPVLHKDYIFKFHSSEDTAKTARVSKVKENVKFKNVHMQPFSSSSLVCPRL